MCQTIDFVIQFAESDFKLTKKFKIFRFKIKAFLTNKILRASILRTDRRIQKAPVDGGLSNLGWA